MLKLMSAISISATLAACAHTHPGQEAESRLNKLPLKVSARTIDGANGDTFQLIEVTVENLNEEWLKIERTEVVLAENPTHPLAVITGPELSDWAKAMDYRQQRDHQNAQVASTAIGLVTLTSLTSGAYNGSAGSVGRAVMVGTLSWAVADSIAYATRRHQHEERTPDDHLYTAFTVPGKMFLRKWVLINKPTNSRVNKLVLDFESSKGEEDRYVVAL